MEGFGIIAAFLLLFVVATKEPENK